MHCSPFVQFSTMNIVGQKVGDGIAGAVAGFTFGGLLVINAVIFFIIGSIFAYRNGDESPLISFQIK